ncbi:glycerophosphodiester phosphodiesterase [Spirosoma sp. HMF4905]|uniref:Glycerophosphodiester phosphodiesterase n=1 Tax=Spirosoma arboris TaxID=2682092 RepID=A0A7K1SEI2_9BACT|nr:glycerophosphodiester phosphodiesterase [Spirosoma arboris]
MKLTHYLLIGLLFIVFNSCRKTYEAIVPYEFSNIPGSGQFVPSIRQAMEGVYTVSNGASQFGDQAVLKWTYLFTGTDTTHYLSIFTGTDATYFNLEGTPEADSLVLKGYWRKLVNASIGEVRLILREKHNGKLQLFKGSLAPGDTLVVDGLYGDKSAALNNQLTLTYNRPLNPKPFSIMAHRSGGRTSDLLPASENSVEIIKLASRLGATGIEVDVRFTKDGVPVLYHDNTLNLRLIQKNGLTGPLEDYTYQQLSTLVRLINGEKIPTLEEALETVVNNTSLNFVWLDTKYIGPMDKVQAIQQKYRQKALLAGRNLRIIIGLPTTEAVDSYKALANKDNTPILCELDTSITRSLDARIWAPRWTLGPQTDEVLAMQAEGLTVFVWTLDEPEFIREFISQNHFDGILSNYSPVVAYYHYIEQQ